MISKILKLCLAIILMDLLVACVSGEGNYKKPDRDTNDSAPLLITEPVIRETPMLETRSTTSVVTQIENQCGKEVELSQPLPGVLVTQVFHEGAKMEWQNLSLGQTISFEEFPSMAAVSTDLTQVAYILEDRSKIIVRNALGEIEYEALVPDVSWSGVIQWNDPSSILLNVDIDENHSQANTIQYFMDGRSPVQLFSEFPNIVSPAPPFQWGRYSNTRATYNADLSRAVYLGYDKQRQMLQMILFNLDTGQKIREFYWSSADLNPPQWLQDGKKFLTTLYPQYEDFKGSVYKDIEDEYPYQSGVDLFFVDIDGSTQRLTNLSAYYQWPRFRYPTLSPDEQQAAFIFSLQGDTEAYQSEIATFDFQTGKITTYCIQVDQPVTPVWSPDGKFLAAELVLSQKGKEATFRTILLELATGNYQVLPGEPLLIGWLALNQ